LPRTCTICTHEERHKINVALVSREPYRNISQQYGVSKYALSRHAQVHIPETLALAERAKEVAEADSLLNRVQDLYKRAETILATVEGEKEWLAALAAIRECRKTLELLGRVTKELSDAPIVNITLNPQYVAARTVLVQALENYPEAGQAVADALGEVEHRVIEAHDGS
jgi:DNA repair ATPase RecN